MAEPSKPAVPSKPAPWNDPSTRAMAFQILALVALAWFFWTLFQNTLSNMESRGITTGFGFLDDTAGFGILFSLIDYSETDTYARTFMVGLLNTLLVSVVGIFLATILGFLLGVARLSNNWLIAKMSLVYIEVIRNVPLLLQIFFWYFAVLRALPSPRDSLSAGESFFINNRGFYIPSPHLEPAFWAVAIAFVLGVAGTVVMVRWANKRQDATGAQFPKGLVGAGLVVGLPVLVYLVLGGPVAWELPELKGFNFRGGTRIIPEFVALLLALTLYTAAFIGETVRAGIQSVTHGQSEAAHALGLSNGKTLRLVVIPQAMRVIIPPLTSQYLNLTKNSSLATAIGYPDLVAVFMGTTLNQTGQAVEIVAMTMAVYLTISLLISAGMNTYNRATALKER